MTLERARMMIPVFLPAQGWDNPNLRAGSSSPGIAPGQGLSPILRFVVFQMVEPTASPWLTKSMLVSIFS